MKITDIVVILALIYMILQRIIIKRKLIIEGSKSKIEKIIFFIGVSILIGIIYFLAKTWVHYLFGILVITNFLTLWFSDGITEDGFSSMGLWIIKWNKISSVTIIIKKDIKISIMGKFRDQILHFNKEDYNKVIKTISSNLPIRAKLEIK